MDPRPIDADPDSATAIVPSVPGSVPATRAFLVGMLRGWSVRPEAVDDAALLATELITNAVTHGEGAVTLAVEVDGDDLRVAVTDHGVGRPSPKEPTVDGEHGRGLWLVQAMSRDWGTTRHSSPDGTTVWFELSVVG
ncbi:ATP-binding protein [Angustibacter aerolatus]